jgi:type IV pilus assembly protein PilF
MRKLVYSIGLLFFLGLGACSSNNETQTSGTNNGANNPEASQINVRLGLGYLQQGNYPRAKEKLLLASQQNASAQSYGALAYYYEQTHENQLAANYYQKAIALNPKTGAPHNNYGAYLCRTGDYSAGEQQFQIAVADPKYINSASAYENAGFCALLVPDKAKAEMYLKKALQQNPRLPKALYELAQLNYEQKNDQQAKIYLDQYSKIKDKSPQSQSPQSKER